VNLGNLVATNDNCSAIALITNNAPASFPVGTNTVTWVVYDTSGNSNTCQQLVIVYPTPPEVSIAIPANNTVFYISQNVFISAIATSACPISNVEFYVTGTNFIGQTTNEPYSVTWSNPPVGTYQLTARAVEINGLRATSAPVTIIVIAPPYTTNTMRLNPQTSLYEQVVTITNTSPFTLDSIAVLVTNKPALVQLYNQTGTTNGFSYIGYGNPLPPGGSVSLTFKYYLPPGQPFFYPRYQVILLGSTPPITVNGTQIPIAIATFLSNGKFFLNFTAIENKTYYVQYSTNLINWKTSPLTVPGVDSNVQWIDDGPPTTESWPMSIPYRFYRVLQVP